MNYIEETVIEFRKLLQSALPEADLGRINSTAIRRSSLTLSGYSLIDMTALWESSSIEAQFNDWYVIICDRSAYCDITITINEVCYGKKALIKLFSEFSEDALMGIFKNEDIVNEITKLVKGHIYIIPDESYVPENMTKQDKTELNKFLNQLT